MGLVVGGASLGVLSLVTEQPAGNTPPATPQVTAPVSADNNVDVEGREISVEAPTDVVATEVNPVPRAAEPQVEIAQPVLDTSPADVPTTAGVAGAMDAPEAVFDELELAATAEEPVLPNPQSVSPQVPVNESDLTVSTTPAALPEPQVIAVAEGEAVAPPTGDIAAPMPMTEEIVVALPEAIAPQIISPEPELPLPPATPPRLIGLPPLAEQAAPSLPSGNGGVVVNRITAIKPEVPDEPLTVSEDEEVAANETALSSYATPFENPDNDPLLAMILLDDGSMKDAAILLKKVPFPVTVVLDPTIPDVVARMRDYRVEGIELGVLSVLPTGAAPEDLAVAFEATFGALPETVLLLDMGDGGLQNDRAVTEQAMEGLASSGRGIVSVSQGLNAALRAAEKYAVPAAVIYRDLDGEGQDARVIRRFMDQAAFKARQESGVILLGRLRPDTISAMQLWGAANRLGQTTVAPVSAILKENAASE